MELRKSTNYLLSAEVKYRDVQITETNGTFGVRLSAGGSGTAQTLVGSSDWRMLSLPFTTAANEKPTELQISLGGRGSIAKGSVEIRNMQLREIRYPE
jgi:hypothetical protein